MTPPKLPDALKSATVMTPMALNKVRFNVNHTLLTPCKLAGDGDAQSGQKP